MAEDLSGSMNDSFHCGSHSSSSFRIVDSAAELPGSRRTTSAPIAGGSHDWDHLGSSLSYGDSRGDSYSRSSVYESPARSSAYHASSSATARPMSPKTPSQRDLTTGPASASHKSGFSHRPVPRVLKTEVWRDLLLTSDGRDKAFKLIQYTMKVYLFFHSKTTLAFQTSKLGLELVKRLKSTASGLSLTRKCLIMFNWLKPLLEITNPPSLPFTSMSSSQALSAKQSQNPPILYRLLHASPPTLLDLFNGIADDVFTCSRLGLIGARMGNQADRIANWLWFLSTLAGLVEVETESSMVRSLMDDLDQRIYDVELDPMTLRGAEKKGISEQHDDGIIPTGKPNNVDPSVGAVEAGEGLEQLKQQSRTLRITRWKLLMDLIFVSYEVFRVKPFREPVMALSGLFSAVLSSSKLYGKQRAKILKALTSE